ncbi:potassium-transporting ATPase subunit KdpC [Nocardioides sp. zg-1228]|uniref:potassium-transporting ATPase subunit KdpC n=1 Tax=Nocardioides sp. zg-1228 TaxID=2763008 RepID=UPI001642AE92|nr:potassium-transporting ATPase subunit KdpC [Nocardioides sp. zg-1228]MBC2932254.1 potassium-transporting ATPase subunit KdpC [Nocardioides sp. zg-1228]QSF57780.1 potassium-transporting ATPase subunit KdpC [Nocardioides sp. zg-1228]
MLTTPLIDLLRQSLAGLRLLLVMTVLLGVGYPGAVWAVGQAFGERADGSPVRVDGVVVGSRLLGQRFEGDRWFLSRPSPNDYDTLASAPSNLGPLSPDLLAAIEERRAEVAAREGVDRSAVPPDAVTASGSGLDPHISPEYAALQVRRVAEANGLTVAQVERLVEEHTGGRGLGFLGEPGVTVLDLNVAVAAAGGD